MDLVFAAVGFVDFGGLDGIVDVVARVTHKSRAPTVCKNPNFSWSSGVKFPLGAILDVRC